MIIRIFEQSINYKGASIFYVDGQGGGGVSKKSTFFYKGEGGVKEMST